MNKDIEKVKEFHIKFKQPVLNEPSLSAEDRTDFRHKIMAEEVEEYKEAVTNKDLIKVADSLADILYATYGTILEHGLQDMMADIFDEIHRSNMSKDYAEYKLIKGPNYFKPNLNKFFE